MSGAVAAIVFAGIIVVILAGLAGGLDAAAVFMFIFIVVLGMLAISVARKSQSGTVQPARCPTCGGLISATAPYCKHCGARVDGGTA